MALTLVTLLLLGGCDLWPRDNPSDEHCNTGGCDAGAPDSGVADLAGPDAPADASPPDAPVPDLLVPDLPAPDMPLPDVAPPDMALPDMALPDMALPDLLVPDLLVPDMALPDMALPDMALPDMALPDMALPDMALPDTIPPDAGCVTGCVKTLAGTGASGCPPVGSTNSLTTALDAPYFLAMDRATDKVYVAATGGCNSVFEIAAGQIKGLAKGFDWPRGVAVDSTSKKIYVSETDTHTISVIHGGKKTLFAGVPKKAGKVDGPALSATFYNPRGLAVSKNGVVYVADTSNCRVRKIEYDTVSKKDVVSTLAGGDCTTGSLPNPRGLAIDGNTLYVSAGDIKKFDLSVNPPKISKVANVTDPWGLALGPKGDLYVASHTERQVYKIVNGNIALLAGAKYTGAKAQFLDDSLLNSKFGNLAELAVDSKGRVIVADGQNHRIRMIIP